MEALHSAKDEFFSSPHREKINNNKLKIENNTHTYKNRFYVNGVISFPFKRE